MYNRYIPQPDGTYRRNQVPDTANAHPRPVPREDSGKQDLVQPRSEVTQPEEPPCQNCMHNQTQRRPVPPCPRRKSQPVSIGSFFKQLLPKDFDTEDLIIVLLLLLMAGDCQEEQNSALLTLMLYLFL